MLEGVIEYRAGDESHELTAGSFLYLPLGVPHAFRIRGTHPPGSSRSRRPAG